MNLEKWNPLAFSSSCLLQCFGHMLQQICDKSWEDREITQPYRSFMNCKSFLVGMRTHIIAGRFPFEHRFNTCIGRVGSDI